MTKEEKLHRLRYNNIIIIILLSLLTWFARCWLGNAHDRSTACKTEDGRHRRPSRGLYLFMMLFCPGESRRKSLFVLRFWLGYIHTIIYNNFILYTSYLNPMFAIGGGVGREITNRECCGPVSKFFASGTFFRPDWTRPRQWRSSCTYTYRNTTCRPAEQRHLQPTRPRK